MYWLLAVQCILWIQRAVLQPCVIGQRWYFSWEFSWLFHLLSGRLLLEKMTESSVMNQMAYFLFSFITLVKMFGSKIVCPLPLMLDQPCPKLFHVKPIVKMGLSPSLLTLLSLYILIKGYISKLSVFSQIHQKQTNKNGTVFKSFLYIKDIHCFETRF